VVLHGANRPKAVTVPQRAVLEGPQGKFVYVVSDKSLAEARPVQAGEWAGERWIITSGLNGGERVIVDGVMKIGPGAPVKVAEKPAEKPVAEKMAEKQPAKK
jgi:membrane fusion protein, multidrug efflux system